MGSILAFGLGLGRVHECLPANWEFLFQEVRNGLRVGLDLCLRGRIQAQPAEAAIGGKTSCLNELRIHRLRKNPARHFRGHLECEKALVEGDGGFLEYLYFLADLGLVGNRRGLGALLLIGVALPQTAFGGRVALGLVVHIAPGNLVARKSDRVAEPFTGDIDGHLQTEADLGMEERGDVVVFRQILDELFVPWLHDGGFLRETDAGGVDDCEVVAESLKEFYETGAV